MGNAFVCDLGNTRANSRLRTLMHELLFMFKTGELHEETHVNSCFPTDPQKLSCNIVFSCLDIPVKHSLSLFIY